MLGGEERVSWKVRLHWPQLARTEMASAQNRGWFQGGKTSKVKDGEGHSDSGMRKGLEVESKPQRVGSAESGKDGTQSPRPPKRAVEVSINEIKN